MQVKKQKLETDMEEQTGSKLGKEDIKAVYLSPCLFHLYAENIVQNASWMNHKLKSRYLREISTTSNMQIIPL